MPGLNREFGLAVVGCGAIGRIRAELARDYPGIGWIGLCDINAEVGHKLQQDTNADFFTTDYAELLARPKARRLVSIASRSVLGRAAPAVDELAGLLIRVVRIDAC